MHALRQLRSEGGGTPYPVGSVHDGPREARAQAHAAVRVGRLHIRQLLAAAVHVETRLAQIHQHRRVPVAERLRVDAAHGVGGVVELAQRAHHVALVLQHARVLHQRAHLVVVRGGGGGALLPRQQRQLLAQRTRKHARAAAQPPHAAVGQVVALAYNLLHRGEHVVQLLHHAVLLHQLQPCGQVLQLVLQLLLLRRR